MFGSASEDARLEPADKQHFQRIFADQAIRSYILLSFGMGVVALSLPIALVATGGYAGHYSISWFYHLGGAPRDVMVGCLWATGVFLFLFHGLSKLENWLLNAAGVFGISVAMNPMQGRQCGGEHRITVHLASAMLFFACLSIVAVGLSKGRVRYIAQRKVRRRFEMAYNAAGAAMTLMPAAVIGVHYLGRGECESHWIFWIETLGIWAFAFFWFVKTLEYRLLLGVRVRLPKRPHPRAAPPS